MGSERVILSRDCGGGISTLKLTSSGNDIGADPMRELHFRVVENDRLRGDSSKAGTRKSGS